MSDIYVGMICVIERRFHLHGTARHRWEKKIVKVTSKRAYFDGKQYFALDDSLRIVKPRYLDYTTLVVEVRST